jgi:hypothetical protein
MFLLIIQNEMTSLCRKNLTCNPFRQHCKSVNVWTSSLQLLRRTSDWLIIYSSPFSSPWDSANGWTGDRTKPTPQTGNRINETYHCCAWSIVSTVLKTLTSSKVSLHGTVLHQKWGAPRGGGALCGPLGRGASVVCMRDSLFTKCGRNINYIFW